MMTKDQALAFLTQYQPLPDDGKELENILEEFNEVRKYFISNPNSICIPLFLNCFGKGSGYGVYQLVEDVIITHNEDEVVFYLKKALLSDSSSIRYWCAQISENYDSEELLEGLLNVYEKGDIDAKCASLTALSGIKSNKVPEIARKALDTETDKDLIEIANDIWEG